MNNSNMDLSNNFLLKKIFSIKIIIVLHSCIGSSLVFLSTMNYGVGLSPDSIDYLATANNLLLGKGFISFDAQPILYWPPLYPILLFFFSYSFNTLTTVSAIHLNALLFGLIIYKSGMILSKFINSNFIIIFGLNTVLFSLPIFSMTLWAWSEVLFVFLVIWYFHFIVSYIEKSKMINFVMIVIITTLLILTRYIGIVFIPATIITLLIYNKESLKKKFISIVVYLILSIIPISIWLLRNYLLSETFFGKRGTTRNSIFSNVDITIEKILGWYIPEYIIDLRIFFLVFVTTAIVFVTLLAAKKIKYEILSLILNKKIVVVLSLVISIYLFAIILISSLKSIDPIDDRLLSPIYIPLTILFLVFLQAFYNRINSFRIYKILFFILLSLMIIKPFSSTVEAIVYHYNNGDGYSGSSWQKDSTEQWLMDIRKSYIKDLNIYSNDPYAVYFLLNTYAKWSPVKAFGNSDDFYSLLTDLEGVWPQEKKAYLVWIKQRKFQHRSLYTPEELQTISDMEIIDSSDIGSLYFAKIKNTH